MAADSRGDDRAEARGETAVIRERHELDDAGRPVGGETIGRGILIHWQSGPRGRGAQRLLPNGAFVEDVIQVALGRLEFYQSGRFACEDNATAITHLKAALAALHHRTAEREARGVEGTHEV